MCGKWYTVHRLDEDESCVGSFESIQQIADYFGGCRLNRIHCSIVRGTRLTFGNKRYRVTVYREETKTARMKRIRKSLSEKYGSRHYMIFNNRVMVYENGQWVRLAMLDELL